MSWNAVSQCMAAYLAFHTSAHRFPVLVGQVHNIVLTLLCVFTIPHSG